MPELLGELQELSDRGDKGFYGSPLSYDELAAVEMPDGDTRKAIRASVPLNFNTASGLYEPHSIFPVVCVAKDFPVHALHRALCHPAHHRSLPLHQRRHGIDSQTGMPTLTKELLEKIRTTDFTSYIYVVEFKTPPFVRFEEELDEWRSPYHTDILDTYAVHGCDLTYTVELKRNVS
jgi:hypothetical protein